MLTLVEEDVPEFLTQRDTVAYCSQLHVNKTKSSLVLGRNLKFYEFRKKELLHHIDLRGTCLQQLATELKAYSGPVSSFLIRDDVAETSGDATSYSMLHAVEELPLSIGKYVWLRDHVYVLLRCWQKLLVLRRPNEHGASFELIAEHDNVQVYRLVKGPIKYQAYVELQFCNGKRLRTNFQTGNALEAAPTSSSSSNNNSAAGFKRLMQRVHCARAELNTQRAQTQMDFERARELHTFGAPGERSPLLEEKQLLRRCGDIWTRICGDALVLGMLLTNTAGSNRATTLHAVRPLLYLAQGGGLNYVHRLYELPLQADGQPPDDYEELAQFWASQEQQSITLSWQPATCVQQLSPERSAVLLVRLQLEDLLSLDSIQLLALYELHGASKRQLQLQLASINISALLEQQELHVPSFAAQTLHQDFLAVIMTQTSHCALRLQFQGVEQQMQFEQLLVNKLGFAATTVPAEQEPRRQSMQLLEDTCLAEEFAFGNNSGHGRNDSASLSAHRIFYNCQSQLLLLRNDPDQYWHIYAGSQTQLCLLLRRLLRDLLQLHCNVSLLELHEDLCSVPANAALLLESALRDELQAKSDLFQLQSPQTELWANSLKRVHQLEMATDLMVTDIKSQTQLQTS
ncbi:uncharacterized protein [Drosophila virilis]|uniref:Uncharacterized protein n=1 Tax=Drosophila virilis TaxID=7244 RepID=B4M6V3_DROVI|nr:uncharacterized protein LOC6633813 [Drosophila virilis]EDW62520.1 uncharacterized protein Dvir_GJ16860 [Drosophila virilis]